MEPSKGRVKKEKAKVTKRIQRLLLVCIILSIPVFIIWYGWANTFFTIIPPNTSEKFPKGAILWSYWDDRADQLLSPDFIQEVDVKSVTILVYNHLVEDLRPMVFPYNRTIHKFVTKDIGKSIFEVIPDTKQDKKQDQEQVPEVVPHMEELDNLSDVSVCGI